MKFGGIGVALVLGLTTMVQAAPLNPKNVAEDAKWVVHVDVDAMRASYVVQQAYHEFMEKCPLGKIAAPIFDKSRELIGMDPRHDLQGMTLYGSQVGKEQGVLIVFANVDQKLLTEKVKKAREHKSSTYGSYEIHTWIHKDKRGERPAAGAFFGDKGIVFSGSEAEVKAALDVLDGKKAGLKCEFLAAEVPQGTTLLVRAAGIADAKLPCKSQVAKQVEAVGVVMGENEKKSFLHVKLVAKSAEVAGLMGEVGEGIRALGMLHAIDCPKDKPLVENLKVTVSDKTVTVDSSAPAEAVWEHMKADMKKAIERHGKMHKWREAHKDKGDKKARDEKK